jgi:hypothetical protein
VHRRNGKSRSKALLLAVLAAALVGVAAGCGGEDEAAPETTAPVETQAPETTPAETAPAETGAADTGAAAEGGENPFGATLTDGEFGESYNPDPALVEQALGGVASLPEDPMERDVMLAGIARASEEVDEAKALECWKNNGCDTGTGGDITVGLADGFGGNVARQLFKMEFILQALTYPEIGEIIYTDSNLDTQTASSDGRMWGEKGGEWGGGG